MNVIRTHFQGNLRKFVKIFFGVYNRSVLFTIFFSGDPHVAYSEDVFDASGEESSEVYVATNVMLQFFEP